MWFFRFFGWETQPGLRYRHKNVDCKFWKIFEGNNKNFSVFFFVLFVNRKLIFVLKQTFFEKKNFLHSKLNFWCV